MNEIRATVRHAGVDRATILIAGSFAFMAAGVVLGRGTAAIAAGVALGMALVAWDRIVLTWPSLVGLLLAIVLFVPIGRYSIAIDLPFDMELYRLAVAAVLASWLASLLVDPLVRIRRTPFDIPILIIACGTI